MKILKKLIPWLIAGGIFYYLFRKYPAAELLAAVEHLRVGYFVLFATLYFFYMWWVDCWSLANLLSRFGIPTRFKDLWQARFASYLIMVANYGAAQGAYAYFIKRLKQVPLSQVLGTIAFVLVIDLYWTISLAFVGSFWARPSVGDIALWPIISVVWAGATVLLVIKMIFWKYNFKIKWLRWVQAHPVASTFRQARPLDYGHALLVRFPLHIAINTALFFVAWTFGVHIPFLKVLAAFPIVILVGTIPITPGGLGTIQVATIELFKDSVAGPVLATGSVTPSELLLAMSLVLLFANYLLKAITGSLFFGKIMEGKESESPPITPPTQ